MQLDGGRDLASGKVSHPEQLCDEFNKSEISTLYTAIRHVCNTVVEKLGNPDKLPDNWILKYLLTKEDYDLPTRLPNGEWLTSIMASSGLISCIIPRLKEREERASFDHATLLRKEFLIRLLQEKAEARKAFYKASDMERR